jgi:hypothetical protein
LRLTPDVGRRILVGTSSGGETIGLVPLTDTTFATDLGLGDFVFDQAGGPAALTIRSIQRDRVYIRVE